MKLQSHAPSPRYKKDTSRFYTTSMMEADKYELIVTHINQKRKRQKKMEEVLWYYAYVYWLGSDKAI